MTPAEPLKVVFVVPDLGIGGAERHVVTLASRMDAGRFQASIVCVGSRGALAEEVADHVPVTSYGHSKRQAARTVWALARAWRRERPDVVVSRGYNAEVISRVAAVLARVRHSVVWVHNCDDTEPRGAVRSLSDKALEPVTDAYFGVANAQIGYLTEELGVPEAKVRIIHNGVEAASFSRPEDAAARDHVREELGFGPADVVVGILAALRPEKDHELFLAAARTVHQGAPQAKFLVVGDGPRRGQLEKLAADLGITDQVVFAGYRTDVARILHAIDVIVLTSYTVECFPMSLLEAMAASLPVVSTDVGGVPEIVDEGVTGFLVPAKEQAQLTERLLALVGDPGLRQSFGRAGRARVTKLFTLEASVREAELRLAEVVTGRSAPPRPRQLTVVMDETAVGGAELVTLRMFEAFDRRVVQPHLICLRAGGPLVEDFRAAGVDVTVLKRTHALDPRRVLALAGELRRTGTDAVLIAHHHRAALVLARLAAVVAGVRTTIVAAHDMDLVPLGGRVLPRSTVATLRAVSALVLLAPSQGDYLHRYEGVGRRPWSRTREVVIPNGIALPDAVGARARLLAREGLGIADGVFTVGIVARLSPQKAHEVLLAAFAELAAVRANTQLVVVGGGERLAELKALTEQLGITEKVLFTGVRSDVAELMPAFDVTCLSSVHEAAPLSVIESMAVGVPVVATDCGALRDMFRDGEEGVLVPVGDSHRLAEELERLAAEPTRRARLGNAARVRAQHEFRIEQTARGYEQLITEVVT